ncbi:MAG: metallophosphoesterase [Flavitalea sp.]
MKILLRTKAAFFILVFFVVGLTSVSGQKKFQKPVLTNSGSWSMIMVPDPQTYMKFSRNQPIFDLMTTWIAENIDTLNIKATVCTGDLVEQNDYFTPNGVNGNQTSIEQWKSVAGAFSKLDEKIPYMITAGNHDYGYKNVSDKDKSRRNSNLYKYFPAEKNSLNKKALRELAPNAEGIPTLENAAYEFTSPAGNKFLVVSIEFAPRDTILNWAKQLVARPVYKNHIVILLTHSYLNSQNERPVKENYAVDGNFGEAIWTKLVQPSSNIRLVLSGHICAPDDIKAHIGFRKDKNIAGKTVNQMAFNAQALGGGWDGNGGDGWLRILEFSGDDKSVKVKTFSPFFAISPTTQQFAWRTESFDEFTFSFD